MADNKFVGEGKIESSLEMKGYFAEAGYEGVICQGILLWAKCMGIFDGFVIDKEESLLELGLPIPVKSRNRFLIMRKNIAPRCTSRLGGKYLGRC